MLRLAGRDPADDAVVDTPDRVLRAWYEMTASPGDVDDLLACTFDVDADEMIGVGPIPFASLCEHHLLPFTGHAWFAYIPSGAVVGLSKIPRLVEHFARRPQIQERLTRQVLDAFVDRVDVDSAGFFVRATHLCSSLRGVRTPAPMTTAALHGDFRTDAAARAEFFEFVRG